MTSTISLPEKDYLALRPVLERHHEQADADRLVRQRRHLADLEAARQDYGRIIPPLKAKAEAAARRVAEAEAALAKAREASRVAHHALIRERTALDGRIGRFEAMLRGEAADVIETTARAWSHLHNTQVDFTEAHERTGGLDLRTGRMARRRVVTPDPAECREWLEAMHAAVAAARALQDEPLSRVEAITRLEAIVAPVSPMPWGDGARPEVIK